MGGKGHACVQGTVKEKEKSIFFNIIHQYNFHSTGRASTPPLETRTLLVTGKEPAPALQTGHSLVLQSFTWGENYLDLSEYLDRLWTLLSDGNQFGSFCNIK